MSRSACTMRRRVARQQDEDGKDVTFSKCLDCTEQEVPVEKVCMVEGCGKKITARGRCSTHYAQYRSEIQKKGRVPVVGEAPKPKTEQAESLFKVKPEVLAARQKAIAERKPGPKRVVIHFETDDVPVWEALRRRARANRRDIRHEAFIVLKEVLALR